MINYCFAAKSNRSKNFFIAVMLSVLISACSSSGSDDTAAPLGPDVTEITIPAGDPTITEPVITEPVITEPVITEPVITEPVITEPVIMPPQNISALTNTPGVDGWVCALGDGTFGAYLFFADLTGRFDFLTNNNDNTFDIDRIEEFTYATTSANSLEILYEFDDGTSLIEVITNIAFADDTSGFTALSDTEGSLTCSRSQLTNAEAESGNSGIPYGVYF